MSVAWRDRFYDKYFSNVAGEEYHCSKKEYDFFARIFSVRFGKFLLAEKGARMLDVACGSGHYMYYVQRIAGYENAEGIDVSVEQIEIAERMGIKNLYTGDVLTFLKTHQNCYDLITAHHFIEHLTKTELLDLLENILAALKPGGRLIVTTGNVASLFGASHICADITHEGGFTPRSMAQLLKTMGFEDILIEGLGPVPYNFRSKVRVRLWNVIKRILLFYLMVERGKGRENHKNEHIIELDILGTGIKKA